MDFIEKLSGIAPARRIGNIESQLIRPATGIPNYRLPERLLAILFTSRTGSTYASQLLTNTPYFRKVAECFNPGQIAAVRKRRGFADDAETVQYLLESQGSDEAFAFKGGMAGLVSANYLGLISAALDRTRFLLLRRRDLIAQAVSLVKAELSGRFHSNQAASHAVTLNEYDAEAIGQKVEGIKNFDEKLYRLIITRESTPTIVYYEDIMASPADYVGRVLGLLDLPATEVEQLEVRTQVIADEINETWIARYEEECGSTRHISDPSPD